MKQFFYILIKMLKIVYSNKIKTLKKKIIKIHKIIK